MAKIRKGAAVTSPLTVSKLHGLVDGATLEGVAPGDVDSNYVLVASGWTPDPTTQTPVAVPATMDIGEAGVYQYAIHLHNNGLWFPLGPYSYGVRVYNGAGKAIPAGSIMVHNPSATYPEEVDITTSANPATADGDEDAWCIAAAEISDASYGVGIVYGMAYIILQNDPSASEIWVHTGDNADGEGFAEAWSLIGTGPNYVARRIGARDATSRLALCFVYGMPLKGG